jgi:tRNA:m4X modification enzyme
VPALAPGNHDTSDAAARTECTHCSARVLTKELPKHVTKCPVRLQALALEAQPYFVRDVNLGSDDEDEDEDEGEASAAYEGEGGGREKEERLAGGGGGGGGGSSGEGASDDATEDMLPKTKESEKRRAYPGQGGALLALIRRVRAACEQCGAEAGAPLPEPLVTPACEAAMEAQAAAAAEGAAARGDGNGNTVAPFSRRHAEQQASIVSHMAASSLVRHTDESSISNGASGSSPPALPPVYVELGAGRGYLSYFLVDAYGPADVLLVERKSYRFKAERSIAQQRGSGAAAAGAGAGTAAAAAAAAAVGSVGRLRVDIKDLDMTRVAAVAGRDVVVTGKHLCGAATDLALRCCLDTISNRRQTQSNNTATTADTNNNSENNTLAPFSVKGVAIATCCHHVCSWRTYVNKPFLRALGFERRGCVQVERSRPIA